MTILLYKGRGPQPYRWRLVAANGKTVADGAEGYATKSNLRRAVRAVVAAGLRARYEEAWAPR